VFVALTAVMPGVLVIVPVVIVIVVTFAWRRNDAARCKHNQPQQEAAFGNGFRIIHGYCSGVNDVRKEHIPRSSEPASSDSDTLCGLSSDTAPAAGSTGRDDRVDLTKPLIGRLALSERRRTHSHEGFVLWPAAH
jgi:hypothetical protein